MTGRIEVEEGGLFGTIQDAGRPGYRKFGVPVSGVMDAHSYRLANWLVGNRESEPVLELTLQGGSFRFTSNALAAVTGSDMQSTINDAPIELNRSISVKAGDRLRFGTAQKACRSYIAIQGEWEVPEIMGSKSTYTTGKFGGIYGRKLEKGDVIEWNNEEIRTLNRKVPGELLPYFSSSNRIRIIPGPEWEELTEGVKKEFLNTEFEVSSESNRMGIRLKGKTREATGRGGMTSSAVLPGIIQLPEQGNPIVLMQDGQTVGGYPRIAKVIEADLWRMAQIPPGTKLEFQMVNIGKAYYLNDHLRGLYKKHLYV